MRTHTQILILALAVWAVTASADEITQWNVVTTNALLAAGKTPLAQSRIYAMAHLAMFDALNSVERRYETYALDVPAVASASPEASVAAAARGVLVQEIPSQQVAIEAQYILSLSAIADGPSKSSGIDIGQAAATAILARRSADGSAVVVPYLPGSGAGFWQPTPPAFAPATSPGWGAVTPFVLRSGSQFRLEDGPTDLMSEQYTADFDEVKRIGNAGSVERTAEQTEIARFHFESSAVEWNRVSRNLANDASLDLWTSARMFALVNAAIADAFISGFDSKYTYNFWRPVTAIRAAESDGNPDTAAEPTWTPLLATPAHPDYPSTHSVASGAAAAVLARFLGTDDVAITATSGSLPGVTRSFTSFSALAEEVGDSRVYAGIHFRTACRDGLRQGRQVGHFIAVHALKPVK